MRRWAFVGAITMVFAVVLGGSAVAGGRGGGGFGTPGRTTQTQENASAFLQDSAGGIIVSTFASAGIVTFKAKGTAGPPTSMPGTMVSIEIGGTNVGSGGFGCWVVPDSMFTVGSGLGAVLHFRSDAPGVTTCPGFALASGLPASGVVPLGGLGFGFVGPVALDLLWPAVSPLYTSRSTTNASCDPFVGNSNISFTDNFGTSASGTISATLQGFDNFGNPIPVPVNASVTAPFADVSALTSKTVVSGPTSGSCGPFGG